MKKSDSIIDLIKALTAFQAEVADVGKTEHNPFTQSDYAPLSEVLKHTRPMLSKHGLSVVQVTEGGEPGFINIISILLHTSGQYIESVLPMPTIPGAKQSPGQGVAGAVTLGRRTAYKSLLSIAEYDDDGNGNGNAEISGGAGQAQAQQDKTPAIDTSQLDTLKQVFKIKRMSADDIAKFCAFFRIGSIEYLPADRFDQALDMLNRRRPNQDAV